MAVTSFKEGVSKIRAFGYTDEEAESICFELMMGGPLSRFNSDSEFRKAADEVMFWKHEAYHERLEALAEDEYERLEALGEGWLNI